MTFKRYLSTRLMFRAMTISYEVPGTSPNSGRYDSTFKEGPDLFSLLMPTLCLLMTVDDQDDYSTLSQPTNHTQENIDEFLSHLKLRKQTPEIL